MGRVSDTGKVKFDLVKIPGGNPDVVVDHICDYEFLDSGNMLIIKNALVFSDRIISIVEKANLWNAATLSNSPSNIYRDNTRRSSLNTDFNRGKSADFAKAEENLMGLFHMAVKLYLANNDYVKIARDTGYEILKYGVGDKFEEHIDAIYGQPEERRRKISLVAYLNSNYEGGELNFARQGLKIKPGTGDILMFPSDFTHPHASLPVISGTKYSLVTWFT